MFRLRREWRRAFGFLTLIQAFEVGPWGNAALGVWILGYSDQDQEARDAL
jgi:hypothetical protein